MHTCRDLLTNLRKTKSLLIDCQKGTATCKFDITTVRLDVQTRLIGRERCVVMVVVVVVVRAVQDKRASEGPD